MNDTRDIEEAAAAWVIRSDAGDFPPEQQEALEAWLQDDERHRVAFATAARAWRLADLLRKARPLDGLLDVDVLSSPTYSPGTSGSSEPVRRESSRAMSYGLLSLLSVTASVLVAAGIHIADRMSWQAYSTVVGGQQRSELADGTTVALNTDTDLRVRITPLRREFRLLRGELVIKAAHDDRRPFTLEAGNTVLQTAGAAFDIRMRSADDVDVLVSTGSVAAKAAERFLRNPFVQSRPAQGDLSAGYLATIGAGDIKVTWLDLDERNRKTAWLTNVINFRGETLTQAAAEFNRYNGRKIVIVDPRIANRRVGGVFRDTDPESFVAALRLTMGVQAVTIGGEAGPGFGTIKLSGLQAPR